MTNELAIRILTGDVLGTTEQTQEAVTMAVRALSKPNVTDTNVGDTISRQAAIDAIYETFCYAYCDNCEKEMNEDLCGDCHRKYQNWAASKKIISKTINSLPSAERNGSWIELYKNNYKCSVCGSWWTCEETPIESGMSYCPNCGARMDSNATQHTECVGNALDALDEVEE